MTLAPARAIAATPSIHAACSAPKAGPTLTPPSGANSRSLSGGIASISESTPKVSHGSGITACRHRAIPDFPELEPPLRTITCVVTAPR